MGIKHMFKSEKIPPTTYTVCQHHVGHTAGAADFTGEWDFGEKPEMLFGYAVSTFLPAYQRSLLASY